MTEARANLRKPIVAVIGDASLPAGSAKMVLASDVGRTLVDAGCRVLTGGLGGVMEAACRGARESANYTPGDTIGILPGTDPASANDYVDVVLPTGLDHARNGIVAQADGVIAIGGGAGTLAEMAFAWMHRRPIVALRVEGWSGRLADQRIDDRDRKLDLADDRVHGADNADSAVAMVVGMIPRHSRRHRGIREVGLEDPRRPAS